MNKSSKKKKNDDFINKVKMYNFNFFKEISQLLSGSKWKSLILIMLKKLIFIFLWLYKDSIYFAEYKQDKKYNYAY